MIRCEKCGLPINYIMADVFDYEGNDAFHKFPLVEHGQAVSFITNSNWCGYELTEEEQIECIKCPHCNEYPFNSTEVQLYDQVEVVMFKDKAPYITDTEIEQWIKKFKFIYSDELEYVFTRGNCYYFAVILREHFGGEIYYLPIENHFIGKINENFYDITGKVIPEEEPVCWATFKDIDELEYNRIIRDCIDFKTRNIL